MFCTGMPKPITKAIPLAIGIEESDAGLSDYFIQ